MVKNQANNLTCITKPLKKACIQLTQASKIWEWFVQPTSWNSHFFKSLLYAATIEICNGLVYHFLMLVA